MSEPSGHKRVKASAALGGTDPAAVRLATKNARIRKSRAVNKTHRAAKRAAERCEAAQYSPTGAEIDILGEQIEQLEEESDDDSLKEFDIIQRRLKALIQQYNSSAAKKANENLEFTCSICFDNSKMGVLRIITPCGHGFCNTCLEKHMAEASAAAAAADDEDPAGPVCPTCRSAIVDVITPFF